jgi:putative ABC transport system permease protein
VYAVGTPGGQRVNFDIAPIDFGFFDVFDVKPLAGRLFSRSHPGDGVLSQPKTIAQPPVIINETAARKLGYATPSAAIGHQMAWQHYGSEDPTPVPSEIVGVVPDVRGNIRAPTDPTFYIVAPLNMQVLSVRMTGRDMPGVIRAIERTWKATGNTTLIHEVFLARSRLALYLDIITQSVTIAICALLAVVIAGLGLFALSAYTTERRTKEIGIRKVMGASTFDVVRLLMWQFTIPVLWAIVIACPVGFLILDHWLHGFAYHVDLSVWTFVLAAGAALVIAWITVSFQSFMVARAKPVGALRYE